MIDWMAKMEVIDKNKVYEIGRNDPVVYHLLTMVERGDITFEQAMMSGVSILSEQNAELRKLAAGLVATSAQIDLSRKVGQGLSPAQEKDIEKIINRALKSGAPAL